MTKKLPFRQVRRSRLSEEVAEQIKKAIFEGLLEPGDSLPSERELGKMFGVGRPTIREALRILNVMGLIDIGAGAKGSLVRKVDLTQYLDIIREQLTFMIRVDEKSIRDVLEIRKYVEIGIAHAAARNASQEDFEELASLIHKMEECGSDIRTYFPIAVEFHKKLALASGNSIFYILWNMFQDILLKGYMPNLEELFPNGPEGLRKANRILLSAIQSGDPEEIDKAMEFHADAERFFPQNVFVNIGGQGN